MGALPRPDVPPGNRRDLVDALHGLHHRAGWPSLRVLAREAGCSHTTVSAVFSSPRLPRWGVLEVLVAAMGGDVARFRRLWLAASTPAGRSAPAELLIAGRKPELAAVRRHLEEGTGLLLVTGEAGMGKTHLVGTASTLVAGSTFVAAGSCLPLSAAGAAAAGHRRAAGDVRRRRRAVAEGGRHRLRALRRRLAAAAAARSSTRTGRAGRARRGGGAAAAVRRGRVRAEPRWRRCGRSRWCSRTCTGRTRPPST